MTTSEMQQQNSSASLDNMRDMLKERGELADFMKQAEKRIKELDEILRPALEGRGEIVAEGFSFKCAMVKGRKSLDKELLGDTLRKQGLTVEDFEKEGAPYTTFTVKKVATL